MEKFKVESDDYRTHSVHDLLTLKDKTVVVTGGARGLGLAVARGCAEVGGNVAVLDILQDPHPGLSLIEKETAATVKYYRIDITDFESLKQVFAQVKADFGSVDSVVNVAGVGFGGAFTDFSQDLIQKTLNVNVVGTISTCQLAVQQMLSQGTPGSIVNIASIGAHGGIRGQSNAVYCASKGAVLSFTKALAIELAETGIRVNSISPGFFLTTMIPGYLDGDLAAMQHWEQSIPMKRLADRAELKSLVVFLLSPASSYMTGEDVRIDAGWSAC